MRTNDDRAQVEVGVDTNPLGDDTEIEERGFRILVLGDFSARGADRPPLTERVIARVDRNGIDAAIAQMAPLLRLSISPEASAEEVSFEELDDFHPDHLLRRVPTLAALRALRAKVESQPAASARPDTPPSETRAPGTGSLLDMILESEPPLAIPHEVPRSGSGDDLSDFIRRAVRPHVAREVDPSQRALVEQVDAVTAATLRVVLHHPDFQALESLWRGVDFLARRCLAEQMAIGLLDLGRAELAAVMADEDGRRALVERVSRDNEGAAWTLVIAPDMFGPEDVELIGRVAAVGAETGVPWLGAAAPALAGAATFAKNGDVDDWDVSALPAWDQLRREPGARFLGLALPRFLLRLPYGTENPVDALSFEELEADAQAHESFLWGNPAFLCAVVASTPVERGRPAPSQGTIDGLPVHVMRGDDGSEGLPCAEALLTQRTVMHMLGRGLTPLVSERGGDAVRITRLQSIAEPASPLPIAPATGDA